MTLRNWFFARTSHAIADLFRRRSAHRNSGPRRGRRTLANLVSETLEPRSMMAVTRPSISIDDVTITEGDAGTKNAAITLRLSQPSSTIVSLRFATANGSATAGSDFVAKAGSVSFAAGTTTKQLLIAIKGDRTYEPNETFSINLSSPKRATIADRSGTVTIANNEPAPTPAPAPATPSPTVTSAAPTVVAAPTPPLAATPSSAVVFSVATDWGSGFNGDVTVRNTTNAAYDNWRVEFDFDGQITSLWNGVIASHSGSRYTIRNESWNGLLAAGSSTTFGFTATPGGSSAVLRNLTLVGSGTATPTPTPTPTPLPIDGSTGRVFLVDPAADDIVGFDPSRDRLDFGDVSVHNRIIAKTETGEVAIVNPWASTPEFQVLRGISYRDLTMANFGVVQNEHLRQDIGGVVSWEQRIGPRDASTVYVRSHEYGVRQRIEGFNPATMKLSFLYFGTRERLSVTDTAEGLSISVLPTNQSILLAGVTKAQLVPGNIEFHHDQIVEDQLEVPFGHPAEHFTLVSRSSLLTPTAPAGQVTDGYQTSIGQPQPGGHDHGTMPTPPPATPTNGDLWKEQFFAPYVDMGQYPVPDLDGLARQYGVGLLTLGFMQASPSGKLAWGGYDVLTLDSSNEQALAIRAEINALRAIGGDVMVSLGGAAGTSLAQFYAQRGLGAPALATAYGEVVDTLKLKKIDFDIEGAAVAEPQTLKLQMDAIALLQKSHPSLGVWLTLPVLPQGLTQDGVSVVKAALVAGVKVDGVNVMAMDYGDSAAPPALKSMGEYAVDAANATFAQMTTLFTGQGQVFGWNQLGVTPMLGVNDVASEIFTLQDADRLETFARAKGLGMLSMWSLNRDNPGPAGQLSNFHTGISTMPAGGFSITWGDYGSDPAIVGAVAPITPAPVPGITIGDVSVAEGNPQAAVANGYLHTSGSQILDANNNAVRIAGVNWFGFETTNFAPHGLWARGYKEMMDQMKSLGFNTIRLPYCDQLFDAGSTPNSIDFSKNADLQGRSGLQIMDTIVAYAGQIGLKVFLDHHRSEAGNSANASGLWYTAAYPESKWISNLTMLATRYAGNSTVIGIDLHNEPHGPATWGDGGANDWRLAAERGGNAVLAANPNLLVIVEGIETASSGSYWWGGNLSNAGAAPVRLSTAGRLVYSAHDYPASVYAQPYFSDPAYPNNLPEVWDKNWGYLFRTGTAPVLLGEFGSNLATASDRAWYSKMVSYLKGDLDGNGSNDLAAGRQGVSWTYWSWNPNSGDTGGILAADWKTVNTAKVDPLKAVQFQFPAVTGTAGAVTTTPMTFTVSLSAASTQPVAVQYVTANGTAVAGSDYTAASGTLTFAPGETQKIVTVLVNRDTAAESNETFSVTLSSPTNATLTKSAATGTVLDDDTVTPTPTRTPTGKVVATYTQASGWGTGFTGTMTLKNSGTTAINGWTMEFDMKANIVHIWNAVIVSHVGTRYVIKNADWNGTIAAGAEISFGFQADGLAGELPSNKKVNGVAV